jgi:hypothetical protein
MVGQMMFWQLTIDATDPAELARFWARALDYQSTPPRDPDTTWDSHYRARLGNEAGFEDRLFDPAGLRPPLWFQKVPETKARKNRLHLDLYPTGRDNALPLWRRVEIVEAKVRDKGVELAESRDHLRSDVHEFAAGTTPIIPPVERFPIPVRAVTLDAGNGPYFFAAAWRGSSE